MLFRRRIQYIFVHVRPLLLTNVMITVGSFFLKKKKCLSEADFKGGAEGAHYFLPLFFAITLKNHKLCYLKLN